MDTAEINKAVKDGNMKMFDVPIPVTDGFIAHWKSPEQVSKMAGFGMFIDIKKTDQGINILSVGTQPELALFLVGVAYGAYNRS